MPPELTPTARSEVIASWTILCFERGVAWEERRDAIREETTIAAEEERPEPVGTVPSKRHFMVAKEGFSR
jgi:hypothetical protein